MAGLSPACTEQAASLNMAGVRCELVRPAIRRPRATKLVQFTDADMEIPHYGAPPPSRHPCKPVNLNTFDKDENALLQKSPFYPSSVTPYFSSPMSALFNTLLVLESSSASCKSNDRGLCTVITFVPN